MAEVLCSVVIPVYNEELVVAETYRRLKSVMEPLGELYELIFVNDGSRDGTSEILSVICESDSNVRLIEFSRNFGHQAAITAGMDYSCGKAVAIIDADLQDPPELIPKMIEKWQEGYDVVYGVRIQRQGETLFKKATSILFYRMLKRIAEVDMPLDTGDFRLIDRKVCDALKKVNEKNRYVRGLISWLGFRQTGIEYTRERRFAGKTKYPLKKMLRFAFDGIASFSYKPLKLAGWCGYAITAACIVYLLASLVIGGISPNIPANSISAGTIASSISTTDLSLSEPELSLSEPELSKISQTSNKPEQPVVSQPSAVSPDAASSAFSPSPALAVSDSPAASPSNAVSAIPAVSGINPYLALSFLINGILLISIGIVGSYIGRIYDEVKARPLYIVRSTKNIGAPADYNPEGRRATHLD